MPPAPAPAAYPPKAPAFDAMPAMPAAPAGGDVSWDEDSSSATSQLLSVFGWENIGPFFYMAGGMAISQLYFMLRDSADDGMDMLEMMKGNVD